MAGTETGIPRWSTHPPGDLNGVAREVGLEGSLADPDLLQRARSMSAMNGSPAICSENLVQRRGHAHGPAGHSRRC